MIEPVENEAPRAARTAMWSILAVLTSVLLISTEVLDPRRFEAVLPGIAVGAGLLSFGAAIKCRGRQRRSWLLLAAGSLGWGCWFSAGADASFGTDTLFNVVYVMLIAGIAAGVFVRGRFASDRRSGIKLTLDALPPVLAVGLSIWLFSVGSFALDSTVSVSLRLAAITHGLGSMALLVLVVAGLLSDQRRRLDLAGRNPVLAVTLLAIGDLLWLGSHTELSRSPSAAAMLAFAAAFALIGWSAIMAVRRGDCADALPAVAQENTRTGWETQLPDLALAALLLVAGWQAIFGETVRYGLATTIAGALTTLAFVLARQSIVLRRDRRLRQEIGQLSAQIDGLISQVGRDPLTGLLNHRAIHERIDHELAYGRASAMPVAVALIDVDNFKSINDALGHQTGDRVLRAVASILTAACRATDVAARYAGDEFMLLLPGLNEARAGMVCERIAQEVLRVNEELRLGHGVKVSLSIGVAVTHSSRRNVSQTVAIADAAMYDAKEGGKNRVVVVNADTLVISKTFSPNDGPDLVTAGIQASFGWGELDRRAG